VKQDKKYTKKEREQKKEGKKRKLALFRPQAEMEQHGRKTNTERG